MTVPDYSRRSGHPQLRALLLSRYIPGITLCWRCHQPITTLNLRNIHLGHDDNHPAQWRGLEHAHCNLQAGGTKRARMPVPMPRRIRRTTPAQPPPRSRQW